MRATTTATPNTTATVKIETSADGKTWRRESNCSVEHGETRYRRVVIHRANGTIRAELWPISLMMEPRQWRK